MRGLVKPHFFSSDRSGKANLGHALETAVAIELERRGAEVSYVKTGAGFEVDFLAQYPAGKRELIQVCADLSDQRTLERETRALKEASHHFCRARAQLVALHLDLPPIARLPKAIHLEPAALWFLEELG